MDETNLLSRPMPSCGNHKGFLNDSTSDSWVEGWAIFWPTLMGYELGYWQEGQYTGFKSLADSTLAVWSVGHDGVGNLIGREDFAVAGVLWDLIDAKPKARNGRGSDNITLAWKTLRDILLQKQGDGSYLQLTTLWDVYHALQNWPNLDHADIDQVFGLHGFFGDAGWQMNGCDQLPIGGDEQRLSDQERYGQSGRADRPSVPHLWGANLRVHVRDTWGAPVAQGNVLVTYTYPPAYGWAPLTLTGYAYDNSLMCLDPPGGAAPVQIEIRGNSPGGPVYRTTNVDFLRAADASTTGVVDEIMLAVSRTSIYLPLVLNSDGKAPASGWITGPR